MEHTKLTAYGTAKLTAHGTTKMAVGYPSIDKPWLKYYSEEQRQAPLPQMTIYQYILHRNQNNLRGVALEFLGRKITYRELFEKIDRTASALSAWGIRPEDTIASCLPNIPEAIYLIYAASKLGAVVDLADPFTNRNLMRDYCNKSHAKLLFTIDICFDPVRDLIAQTEVEKIVVLPPTRSAPLVTLLLRATRKMARFTAFSEDVMGWDRFCAAGGRAAVPADVAYRPDMPVAILHAGGSTGVPKGVLLSNDNLNSLAHQCYYCDLNMKRGESALNLMPAFASYGLGNGIHVNLSCGIRLILIPTYEPSKLGEQIEKYRPNRIAGSPAHYEDLLKPPFPENYDLSFLQAPIVGGDTLNENIEIEVNALLARLGCRFKIAKGFGMAETCSGVCVCINNEVNVLGSVGVPLAHNLISVFDEDDHQKELPCGGIGEICVSGPNVMLGYLDMPEENAAHLIRHADGTVWLRTGDIGYMTEDGNLFIKGCAKRIVIRNDGLKCYSFDVEKVISLHPSVLGAFVVPCKDPRHVLGDLPIAYILVDRKDLCRADAIVEEIDRLCQERIVYYSLPADYIVVDDVPRTKVSKVDYAQLAENYRKIAGGRTLRNYQEMKF